MQKIIHPKNYHTVSPVFDEIELFYALTSEKTLQKNVALIQPVFDNAFKDLQSLFNQYGSNCNFNFNFTDKQYKKIEPQDINKKNIILCFSGGKDSIVACKRLKEQNYNVYLYHQKKINAVFDEYEQVIKLAKYLDCPLYLDESLSLSGHHDWIEHPMKNMIIANGALHYGIINNISTTVAFGNYIGSTVETDNFDFCGGDDMEMWDVYERIVQKVIPAFKIKIVLQNNMDTLRHICADEALLNLSLSCLGRAGLRRYNQKRIENKYNIVLPKNRCGMCYKCAVEYLYRADADLTPLNKDYYMYCIDVLYRNSISEGALTDSIENIWYYYFDYPLTKSKMYEELKEFM